jgi:hypothetical protein
MKRFKKKKETNKHNKIKTKENYKEPMHWNAIELRAYMHTSNFNQNIAKVLMIRK